ncbi:hypothetical protein, partial [Salmonella sp. s51228]|uniref:hypothetical protein n=1 Tax=Salmonella sp. s51228 TaxID=3159652 RepID=UPI003980DA1E
LNSEDLDTIGVVLPGHRKKILFNINKLTSDATSNWLPIDQESYESLNKSLTFHHTDQDLSAAIEGLEGILGGLSKSNDESSFIDKLSKDQTNLKINVQESIQTGDPSQ